MTINSINEVEIRRSMLGQPRLDKPCERCGWRWQGFHICFDASKPVRGERRAKNPGGTSSEKSSNSDSKLTDRQRLYRDKTRERDAQILDSYKDGYAMRDLVKMYKAGYQTVINIIRAAEAETGEKIMRPRGSTNQNTKKPRKEV